MSSRYPKVTYTEQGLREGMQIEDANISIDDKIELLNAIGETVLKSPLKIHHNKVPHCILECEFAFKFSEDAKMEPGIENKKDNIFEMKNLNKK